MEQKIALVTGANRGLGLEIVRQLCTKGYHCILTSRKEADGRMAVEKLSKYASEVSYHVLDVVSKKSVESIRVFVETTFGRLDALVNNAAWNYDLGEKPSTVDLGRVDATMDTNFLGPWRMCQAFIPMMKRQTSARIVNVSSGSGSLEEMTQKTPAYGISKAALNFLTLKLADELKGTGILVNAVCPGWVRTDMGGSNAPRSVAEGAEGVVWLADLGGDGPSGGFYRDKKRIDW